MLYVYHFRIKGKRLISSIPHSHFKKNRILKLYTRMTIGRSRSIRTKGGEGLVLSIGQKSSIGDSDIEHDHESDE